MTSRNNAASRRAVFIDVDGTLVRDGHYIPDSAREAVRTARQNGHLVFLSTGRALPELRGRILDVGFDGAVTAGGGFAALGDDVILSRLMPEEDVVRLEELFTSRGLHWYLQAYDQIFASPGLPALMQRYHELDWARHMERARREGIDPDDLEFSSVSGKVFDAPESLDRAAIAKAVVLTEDAEGLKLTISELAEEFTVVTETVPVPVGTSGEVSLAGVNKGSAIREVLAHVAVDPASAIGIGDNWNDVEMFEMCGLSISMGNAVAQVQALTDQVTTALDDDGIYNAFARNGLI